MAKDQLRTEILESGPLHYAPQNEQGVVFLFAHISRKLRLRVDQIRQGFPDCIAYEKSSNRERRIRIEFEYKSSSFKAHHHSSRGCDCIVCWEHDWPDCPKNLRIIELRKYFGLGFKVWFQPVDEAQFEALNYDILNWGARKSAHQGDLMLMYRCSPEKCIREIYFLFSDLKKRGRCGPRWPIGGELRIVARLKHPIFLEDMRAHRVIKTAGFVKSPRGNSDVTQYWPYIYELIINRNKSVKKVLSKYAPERLDCW